MAYHFIAIASYYDGGGRIAWHFSSEQPIKKQIIRDFLTESKEELGDLDFGIHRLTTDSTEWVSVTKRDSFFDDIIVYDDKVEFLKCLREDKEITALDIAKMILSIRPVSHLKLQKLIYLVYKDFLERTHERLFEEKIIAYKYGPVVEEVYDVYKVYGRKDIELDDTTKIRLKEMTVPIAMGKILLSDQATEILKSVDITLHRYKTRSANDLVKITHRKGGAWDAVYQPYENCEITDEIILSHAKNELDD